MSVKSQIQSESGNSPVRLLISSGRLALLSLIAALSTIAFVFWMQSTMQYQYEVAEPLAQATLSLRNGLSESEVALKRWETSADEDARAERLEIWKEDIEPNLASVASAAEELGVERDVNEVAELRKKVRRAKYLQWLVEEVVHAPLNEPAKSLYETEMVPLRTSIVEYTYVETSPPNPIFRSPDDQKRLLVLVIETDSALLQLLGNYSPAQAGVVRRWIKRTQDATEKSVVVTSDSRQFKRELAAFLSRADSIMRLRASDGWNQSRSLYLQELKPLLSDVRGLVQRILDRQNLAVRNGNRSVFRWSFLILILALLVGILSAFSLYFSVHTKERVEAALTKAKSLGHYVIEGKIGTGGMGQILRAKHALLKRPAAIKVLRSERLLDADAQARFHREVQITSLLTHPNTIAIYDYGKTPDGFFYYAMEYLEGVSLKNLVEIIGPLPANRVIHILRQICQSLSEAHARGLLHRDIKPSNVILAELGGIFDFVKVFDFGLVMSIDDPELRPSRSKMVGTPAFMAPETIGDPNQASPRSDIYSIGVLAYRLLAGTLPFEYADRDSMLDAHIHLDAEPPSKRLGVELPRDLEAIIMGCLEKKPERRPQEVCYLLELLEDIAIDPWTSKDAETWWHVHGEAVRARAESKYASEDSAISKTIDIEVLLGS